jgi:hypothetical protein
MVDGERHWVIQPQKHHLPHKRPLSRYDHVVVALGTEVYIRLKHGELTVKAARSVPLQVQLGE